MGRGYSNVSGITTHKENYSRGRRSTRMGVYTRMVAGEELIASSAEE
jgi:hypothetical protein